MILKLMCIWLVFIQYYIFLDLPSNNKFLPANIHDITNDYILSMLFSMIEKFLSYPCCL
jgi:hypothetical protein